jgi:UDP-N-acetyl-D-mannosaminuronic acid dehydrogenase
MKKKVCVVGLGYIGLPTAALLASKGYNVVGMDISAHVVEVINKGKIHIVEPDLEAYVCSGVITGSLRAFSEVQPADIYMICVPTPFHDDRSTPRPNIDYVMAAVKSIVPLVKAGDLVILESTSPVGTTEQIQDMLLEANVAVENLYIAYCPERVLPGNIMTELVENDRVVGGTTPEATRAVAEFYRSFVHGEVLETDAKTAEMCKLTENSFRDVNIAFANELSILCAKDGINVWNLIRLANRHPRVEILQPGTGVGGHCIAVDPWFIVARDEANAQLIRTAREVNNRKTVWVIQQIKAAAANFEVQTGKKPKIACLGLAFKPNIDDLRESPALDVALALVEQAYSVIAVEPNISLHYDFALVEVDSAINNCDVLAILVKHREFMQTEVRERLKNAGALDFCGALN